MLLYEIGEFSTYIRKNMPKLEAAIGIRYFQYDTENKMIDLFNEHKEIIAALPMDSIPYNVKAAFCKLIEEQRS